MGADRAPGATEARGLPLEGLLLLAGLTLFWGLNWPAMKIALADIPPWTFRTICLIGGASLLFSLTLASGRRIAFPPALAPRLALVSLFSITGWHLLSAYGLLNTTSGRAAIIGYTMPLWASVLSVLVLKVRIGGREMGALGLGLVALLLLASGDLARIGAAPLGALFMSLAALSWATGTILVKRFAPWPMPVTALTGWQQLIGAGPVLLGMVVLEPVPDPAAWSWASILATTYAVTVAMVFCFTAYFRLVELLPAHVAAISTLATPVVGVISGALILGEPVGGAELTALALVVCGLFLLARRPARP
jgi:drug/metabolite transporter (DMT)-like permease